MPAPVGAVTRTLPVDATSVWFQEVEYFECDNVYFRKTPEGYKRHLLGVSDNVTWFSEQLAANQVSTSFYKVTFKPSVIIPAIELR